MLHSQEKSFFYTCIAIILFQLFFNLGYLDLSDWDESLYSEVAKQIHLTGNWIDPKINGHTFVEKPPFSMWMQALSYKVFGIDEFAARLPGALAGLLFGLLFFLSGKKLIDERFGLIWALIYLTSIIPSFIARSALTDNIFNLFITLAVFFLYFYELTINQSAKKDFKKRALFLTLSGVFIGCAVLSKGPVGGAIPVISYCIYKLFYRKKWINIFDLAYLGVISSLIGFSWYFLFTYKYGGNFIEGFLEFHLALFSTPLQYQSGPFYYHFVLMFFGFLPWSVFLFSFNKNIFSLHRLIKPICCLALIWVLFVLTFTALVATKLPHYSATIYIPYSLFCALIFYQAWRGRT